MTEQNESIGVDFRAEVEVFQARAAGIADWLGRYANLVQERGWIVTIHTSESQFSRYSTQTLARGADRVARRAAPFLLVTVERDADQVGSSVSWLPRPFPFGTASLEFELRIQRQFALTTKEWRELAIELAIVSGAAQGVALSPAVPRQFRHDMTVMERRGLGLGPSGLQRYIRQPGWAVWLTGQHLQVLGGRARVRHEAPVHEAIERDDGMWLELTPDPLKIPQQVWDNFEAYLAPLAPTELDIRTADKPRSRAVVDPPTAADHYGDYVGPALHADWLGTTEDSLGIHVHLRRIPSTRAASALNRAVLAWYQTGADREPPRGGLHELDGPYWEHATAHWTVDLGFADPRLVTEDLLHRLAAWSTTWNTPVREIQFGIERD